MTDATRFDTLLIERNDCVARITLNRPERLNALANTTTEQLRIACSEAIDDPEVRVLVLTGAGDAFCAGGDYKDVFDCGSQRSADEWRKRLRNGANELVRTLIASEKPIIACINGVAVGGGATIALACDIRIASDRARFGFPFARIGATPEFGCTYLLPRVVGLGKAIELLFLADMIDAHEAERVGIVHRVAPHEELQSVMKDVVDKLMTSPPSTLGMIKTMLYRSLSMDLQSALEFEALALGAAFKSVEHREAVDKFLKRKGSGKRQR